MAFKLASAFIELSTRGSVMPGLANVNAATGKVFSGLAEKSRGLTTSVASVFDSLAEKAKGLHANVQRVATVFGRIGLASKAAMIAMAGIASPVAMIQFGYVMRDLAGVIGRELVPYLQMLTRAIRYVADSFASLDPTTRKVIALLAVVGTSAATLIGLLPLLTGGISGVVMAIKLATAAMAAFNVSTGGLLLIVGALVTAVVSLGTYLFATKDGASTLSAMFAGVGNVLTRIKNAALALWDALKPLAFSLGQALAQVLIPVLGAVASGLAKIAEFAAAVLTKAVVNDFWRIGEALRIAFTEVGSLIRTVGGHLAGLLPSMATFADVARFMLSALAQGLQLIVTVIGVLLAAFSDPRLFWPTNFLKEVQERLAAIQRMKPDFEPRGKPDKTSVGAGGGGTAAFTSIAEVQRKIQLAALMTPKGDTALDIAKKQLEEQQRATGLLGGIAGSTSAFPEDVATAFAGIIPQINAVLEKAMAMARTVESTIAAAPVAATAALNVAPSVIGATQGPAWGWIAQKIANAIQNIRGIEPWVGE